MSSSLLLIHHTLIVPLLNISSSLVPTINIRAKKKKKIVAQLKVLMCHFSIDTNFFVWPFKEMVPDLLIGVFAFIDKKRIEERKI